MRVVVATDAWFPQTNGVVRTLATTVDCMRADGVDVHVISPQEFRTVPCPTYPEIRLSLFAGRAVARRLERLQPTAVHISTEGPIGLAARRWCLRNGHPFTTAYHTQFPEYVRARAPVPLSLGYAWMRWFHGAAARTLVATPSMRRLLESRGFSNLVTWSRGVDSELFRPGDKQFLQLPRPVWLYLGRVAVEKGIEDFLGWTCPAASWWSAMAPRGPNWQRSFRRRTSSASGTARTWPVTSRRPTCSCSPAAPTRLAWSCSRRWPAACRSRPIR